MVNEYGHQSYISIFLILLIFWLGKSLVIRIGQLASASKSYFLLHLDFLQYLDYGIH